MSIAIQSNQSGDRLDEKGDNVIGPSVHPAGPDPEGGEALHRNLRSRHASMLAIGGAIGTGLILGSGTGLARAGPVGLLIAFAYVGSLCYAMMVALGEMAAFLPHQRGFPGHSTRFVGDAFGAMTGWVYYFKYLLTTPTQFSAVAVLINYWIPATKVNNGVWVAVLIVLTGTLQFMPVQYFGEAEFWFSTFKVVTLTGLMLLAIVIDCGGAPRGSYLGFSTWRELAFSTYLFKGNLGRFCGFVSGLITAVYSYTGTEMVGIALGEMRNPRKNIARAVRACFYRIVFLYCGSIFFVGLIVPANSKLLLEANSQSNTANASPFVVAINIAGIRVLPHIINAAALIFVVSAANSDVYVNSRTLYMLAKEGNAPKIFLTVNRWGVPYLSVAMTLLFSTVAFTTVSASAYKTFKYFVSAVTVFATLAWISIFVTHLRFMAASKRRGINRAVLPYFSTWNPYLSWWGLAGTTIISITKGFDAFTPHFNKISFVTNYIGFPISLVAYLIFLARYRKWYTPIEQVDLDTGVREFDDEQTPEDDGLANRKKGVWAWIKYAWNS